MRQACTSAYLFYFYSRVFGLWLPYKTKSKQRAGVISNIARSTGHDVTRTMKIKPPQPKKRKARKK